MHPPWALLTVIVTLGGAGWLAWAWWWPWTWCRRCGKRTKGQGLGSTRHGWNRCRKCGPAGTETPGEQVRHTARVISKVTGHPVRGSKEQQRK